MDHAQPTTAPEASKGGAPCRPIQSDYEPDAQHADTVDRMVHAWQARFTASISPAALLIAYLDWAIHLANAPGKRVMLAEKAVRKAVRFVLYASRSLSGHGCDPCIAPLPQDRRFVGEAWQKPPFDLIYQSFLLWQQWWHNATTGIRGVSSAHERIVSFVMRQLLDVWAPSNFPISNPEILQATVAQGGQNFLRGAANFLEDWQRAIAGRPHDCVMSGILRNTWLASSTFSFVPLTMAPSTRRPATSASLSVTRKVSQFWSTAVIDARPTSRSWCRVVAVLLSFVARSDGHGATRH